MEPCKDCRVTVVMGYIPEYQVVHCPLHAAASETKKQRDQLLKASKLARAVIDNANISGNWWQPARDDLLAAIAATEVL